MTEARPSRTRIYRISMVIIAWSKCLYGRRYRIRLTLFLDAVKAINTEGLDLTICPNRPNNHNNGVTGFQVSAKNPAAGTPETRYCHLSWISSSSRPVRQPIHVVV